MKLTVEPNITFEGAIALTQNFLEVMEELSETEKEEIISSLVSTENGARGFFVTYLTSTSKVVDQESLGIINGLKTSPDIVGELLVKNVAMSTAMKITHQRNQDEEMANNSQRLTNRSIQLINCLSTEEITTKMQQMIETIEAKKGNYQNFLERWGYDQEQKQVILDTFLQILSLFSQTPNQQSKNRNNYPLEKYHLES